ncbi:WhiB family transcriptional regulator [Streptomyces sp. NPDC026665]|uniref:WhiB family transcriptional regulator n=1 Tax=Streptomyces sp. NPDC026665 TaxID=3154798 RepID=UPI0033F75B72
MEREWELRAACRYTDPDVFSERAFVREAKDICNTVCRVRAECLEAVLDREAGVPKTSRHGIVAGLTGAQRWTLATRRKRQQAAATR